MSDDGAIYEGRKATGRSRHHPRIPKSSSEIEPRIAIAGRGDVRQDFSEPELAHPGAEIHRIPQGMSSGMAKAATIRNIGKQVFMSVVKETVELVALEAASKALQEEIDEQQRAVLTNNARRSRDRTQRSTPIPPPSSRPPLISEDSAGASTFDNYSPRRVLSRRSGTIDTSAFGSADRHHVADTFRNGRQAEVITTTRRNGAPGGGSGGARERSVSNGTTPGRRDGRERSMSFRDTGNEMQDQEREMLLSLLTGAYDQVNELTDELQLSLQKLHETEKELKEKEWPPASRNRLRRSSSTRSMPRLDVYDMELDDEPDSELAAVRTKKGMGTMMKGLLPQDEGARSTPATVRQLQAEVQRLRQRVQQANAGEERQRADLARVQRLMAVMESQLEEQNASRVAEPPKTEAISSNRLSRSISAKTLTIHRGPEFPESSNICVTPGGTRYQEGVTKPLVDRVAELEEKLVNSSMENATAKQDYLTMKLQNSQLEKTAQLLRHELEKSEAMNELLQHELDRLQGQTYPEDGDGKGWKRWLVGLQEPLQEPLSPEPIKISSGDSDSPVVVVRDLDNNQLVYAPGRGEFP